MEEKEMKIYKVYFKGWYIVIAENEEEAEKKDNFEAVYFEITKTTETKIQEE